MADLKRGVLYFDTDYNYSKPATNASDSIIAVDMKTGRIRWIHQVLEEYIWNGSCVLRGDHNPFLCQPSRSAEAMPGLATC